MENEIQNRLLSFYEKTHTLHENVAITDLAEITAGWENEVYSFTVESGKAAERKREELVLRIYQGDGSSEKAAKEFSGMRKLHEVGFPVPEVLILELDSSYFGKPFVIMEKVNGRSMERVIDESYGEKKQKLITMFCKMFVDLHALDWRPFAPDPPPCDMEDPHALARHGFYSAVSFPSIAQETIERFQMDGFTPVLDWLRERSMDVFSCERLSVIHFDYHPNNILLRDDGKAFVIDWTNIGVGDFRMDLAWTIMLVSTYGNPEARRIVLDEYERIVGYKVEQIEYFDVMACCRRLFEISVSLTAGADKLGARPEAVISMKQDVAHIRRVYALMYDRTAVAVPEVETLISTLS